MDGVVGNLLQQTFPYTWEEHSIPYLGTHLTKSVNNLFQANYIPFCTKLQNGLALLAKYEFSWAERLAAFKMMHLPQLLYLFRTLPIPIPSKYFRILQAILTTFIQYDKGKNPDVHIAN